MEFNIVSNPIGALTNTIQTQAHNQALMSIQYLSTPQTPLFVGSDINALRPSTIWTQIVTDIQAPAWSPANINQPALFTFSPHDVVFPNITWTQTTIDVQTPTWIASTLIPEPTLFTGISDYALKPNTAWTQFVIALQNPTWIPSVSIPQPSQFVGSDTYALYPNIYTSSIITYLQAAAWLPAVALSPQTPLFAGISDYALRANTNWNVPNNYLQAPEWLQLPAQPVQSTPTIIASLLANQISLQSQLQNAATSNLMAEEYVSWLWRIIKLIAASIHYFINITEALGSVTEAVSKHKFSFLSELLGNCIEAVTKNKIFKRNVSDSDNPPCPPSPPGTGKPGVRELGGKRKLSIHRNPDQP